MKTILVAFAALGLGISTAVAGPLAPGMAEDGLEFGGLFDNPGVVSLGDTIEIRNLRPNLDQDRFIATGVTASAGAYELGAVALASLPSFGLTLGVGAANDGVNLPLAYDRSDVANYAFHSGAAAQTGILNATITSTLVAAVVPVATGIFDQTVLVLGGELRFDDGLGIYDPNLSGSWNLISVFTSFDDPVALSFSVSTVEFHRPTEAPEPAMLAMIGAGLLGLGLVTRRRT